MADVTRVLVIVMAIITFAYVVDKWHVSKPRDGIAVLVLAWVWFALGFTYCHLVGG